jgi:hypothetical protein
VRRAGVPEVEEGPFRLLDVVADHAAGDHHQPRIVHGAARGSPVG